MSTLFRSLILQDGMGTTTYVSVPPLEIGSEQCVIRNLLDGYLASPKGCFLKGSYPGWTKHLLIGQLLCMTGRMSQDELDITLNGLLRCREVWSEQFISGTDEMEIVERCELTLRLVVPSAIRGHTNTVADSVGKKNE